jgi:hypothetical protein
MSELLDLPEHITQIIEESKLTPAEKILVAQIMHNYYFRGLLWYDEDDAGYARNGVTDSTIAVTELIVFANCLKKLGKSEK